jgi:hypothetical protein
MSSVAAGTARSPPQAKANRLTSKNARWSLFLFQKKDFNHFSWQPITLPL